MPHITETCPTTPGRERALQSLEPGPPSSEAMNMFDMFVSTLRDYEVPGIVYLSLARMSLWMNEKQGDKAAIHAGKVRDFITLEPGMLDRFLAWAQ